MLHHQAVSTYEHIQTKKKQHTHEHLHASAAVCMWHPLIALSSRAQRSRLNIKSILCHSVHTSRAMLPVAICRTWLAGSGGRLGGLKMLVVMLRVCTAEVSSEIRLNTLRVCRSTRYGRFIRFVFRCRTTPATINHWCAVRDSRLGRMCVCMCEPFTSLCSFRIVYMSVARAPAHIRWIVNAHDEVGHSVIQLNGMI